MELHQGGVSKVTMHGRTQTHSARTLDLPPSFQAVALREFGDAFAHAKTIAAEQGAGTIVYVGRFDVCEFAVVLEPEEPLAVARRAFYAGMVALHDALSVSAPPERPVTITWPDAIHVDGGLIGGGRMAWPEGAQETEPPAWLVFGAAVRLVEMGNRETGLHPLATALSEEGFDEVGAEPLVESFARHLMFALDAWRTGEFSGIMGTYLKHLKMEKGATPSFDRNGDLLVRWRGQKEPDRMSLAGALATPTWLDPATGAPRT